MRERRMIAAILGFLEGCQHVAVGSQSPIPAAAALLHQARGPKGIRVSLLGSVRHNPFTDGGRELFDCAAQGRIDAFFLSGGQIDGSGNINLVGSGHPAGSDERFPGTFGAAYLYFLVPKVILFRERHDPASLVEKVDFVSAPGTSPEGVYRPGGPVGLVTGCAVFDFEKPSGGFRLSAMAPGETVEKLTRDTGFGFSVSDSVPEMPDLAAPDRACLAGPVADMLMPLYPGLASRQAALAMEPSDEA